MKSGAQLRVQDGSFDITETREAVLAGLVEKDGAFQKLHDDERAAIPLRLATKKIGAQAGTDVNGHNVEIALDDDDEELIDEDTLLSDEDLKKPQQRKSTIAFDTPSKLPC